MSENLKVCKKCKVEKNSNEFYNFIHGKNGKNSRCKICTEKQSKEYRAKVILNKYPQDLLKTCSICKEIKSLKNFSTKSGGKYNVECRCKQCEYKRNKQYKLDNPHITKNKNLKSSYGIDLGIYNDMYTSQNGVCMICKNPETSVYKEKYKTLAVDHCHKTSNVRGLLCMKCNHAIGMLKDSPELLRKAAEYIEFYRDRELVEN